MENLEARMMPEPEPGDQQKKRNPDKKTSSEDLKEKHSKEGAKAWYESYLEATKMKAKDQTLKETIKKIVKEIEGLAGEKNKEFKMRAISEYNKTIMNLQENGKIRRVWKQNEEESFIKEYVDAKIKQKQTEGMIDSNIEEQKTKWEQEAKVKWDNMLKRAKKEVARRKLDHLLHWASDGEHKIREFKISEAAEKQKREAEVQLDIKSQLSSEGVEKIKIEEQSPIKDRSGEKPPSESRIWTPEEYPKRSSATQEEFMKIREEVEKIRKEKEQQIKESQEGLMKSNKEQQESLPEQPSSVTPSVEQPVSPRKNEGEAGTSKSEKELQKIIAEHLTDLDNASRDLAIFIGQKIPNFETSRKEANEILTYELSRIMKAQDFLSREQISQEDRKKIEEKIAFVDKIHWRALELLYWLEDLLPEDEIIELNQQQKDKIVGFVHKIYLLILEKEKLEQLGESMPEKEKAQKSWKFSREILDLLGKIELTIERKEGEMGLGREEISRGEGSPQSKEPLSEDRKRIKELEDRERKLLNQIEKLSEEAKGTESKQKKLELALKIRDLNDERKKVKAELEKLRKQIK